MYGLLVFVNTQAVRGHGQIALGNADDELDLNPGVTVTLGRHLTLHGRSDWINPPSGLYGGRLVNKGTITTDSPSQTLTIYNCTNTGTVTTRGGTVNLENCTNTGTVAAAGGTVLLSGRLDRGVVNASNNATLIVGTLTNRGGTLSATAGATVLIYGTVTNTGSTLTLTGAGIFYLQGALVGGTVVSTVALRPQGQSGTLDGVTLDADLDLATEPDAQIAVRDGLTLNGTVALRSSDTNYTFLDFQGTQTVDGRGSIVFESGINNVVQFKVTSRAVLRNGALVHQARVGKRVERRILAPNRQVRAQG